MGKHKPLSLDTHKYKTTFTSTRKLVLRFSITNLNWAQETEPAANDPAIQAATANHRRKRMEEEWEEKCESWFIQKGFLRGVTMNMRNALDEQYYLQLKNINTAYHNTTPIQIQEHLDTRWCPLNVRARKLLKATFQANWDNL